MYCPQCGTQNIEIAKFCRLCGVRIQSSTTSDLSQTHPPDYERALKKLFMGIALLIIAFIPLAEGEPILWWLLFPGLPLILKGIRQLTQAKFMCSSNHQFSVTTPNFNSRQTISTTNFNNFRAPNRVEFVPPSSVTERTTKLFEGE